MSDHDIEVDEDAIFLPLSVPPSSVTVTLPREHSRRVTFPNFDPSVHVLKVDHLPDWFSAGDVIEYRKGRTYARSISQTEPRWKAWWRRFKTWYRK